MRQQPLFPGSSWAVRLGLFGILFVMMAAYDVALADDEAFLFTPPGFAKPGVPKTAVAGAGIGTLRITIVDKSTGKPTPCRINVVGPDGDFYQPAANRLTPFSLTGDWPKSGKGNRKGKAPIRYYGRFFYTTGQVEVNVPAGRSRIEVWKGLEFRPAVRNVRVSAEKTESVSIPIGRTVSMASLGYHSGDPHLHLERRNEADDEIDLDLLEAEDLHYGSILAYNEPAGPYAGDMKTLDFPQPSLGKSSVRTRGDIVIASGQEYRSSTYGHLNLFWRDDLVLKGQKLNADNGPPYGKIGRDTINHGGFAIYAHGGYAQSIYADAIQKNVNAVELLQFGVYRGIELADWYAFLNIGYRFPCVGASDYPACRKLSDCVTYVYAKEKPGMDGWLKGAVDGKSFVTTGPLLVLEVEGEKPGGSIARDGTGPHRVKTRVRVTSEIAPVTHLQLIVNGEVVRERSVHLGVVGDGSIEIEADLELTTSSWVAARAYSESASGSPDTEAHTNPVYVYLNGKAPYDRASVDRLVAGIDRQMAIHRKRTFAEKAEILDVFQKSRDILLKIRQTNGLPASGVPDSWLHDITADSFDATLRTHTDEELKSFLKPLPSLSPAEALKTFEAVDGFRMELVVSEPSVASPAAAAFDAGGNLFVAELRDYPYKPKPGRKPLGSVRLLRDKDHDGVFEDSTIFAEELLWPTGIACWKGGIFVAAAPDIWYMKDIDGDGKADVRTRIYTGFGTQNQQAMLNNLIWGLDHKIYGSTAGNAGKIRSLQRPGAPEVDLQGKDFRFDPVTGIFESITGTVQFGNTFDDWGNRFTCSESQPLLQLVLPQHYLARNPYFAVPTAVNNIAGGGVPIFRISPIERWRQIRSSRRIAHGARSADSAGASHHVTDATAGVTIYRGSAYPSSYYGTAFVGDAQNNLVHHRILVPDGGATFKSIRAPLEQNTELVRSSDNWFRPVNFVNAPDGTMYVLDLSREVLEAIHIPLDVVKHLDLRRGRNQGRIYRITPPGFVYKSPPDLNRLSTAELVSLLKKQDIWYRENAMRLIYERQDQRAIESLQAIVRDQDFAFAPSRADALWTLQGLKALREEDLLVALGDREGGVRAQALVLSEPLFGESSALRDKSLELSTDADPRVRYQAAFSLGEMKDPRAVAALTAIARRDSGDQWTRAAVLSSLADLSDRVLIELLKDPDASLFKGGFAAQSSFITQLATIVGVRGRSEEVLRVLDAAAALPGGASNSNLQRSIVLAIGRGLNQAGGRMPVFSSTDQNRPGGLMLASLTETSKKVALDSSSREADRVAAVGLIGALPLALSRETLAELLEPRQPQAVQIAAVRALSDSGAPEAGGMILERTKGFVPAVRTAAAAALLGRPEWTRLLLRAIATPGSGLGVALIAPDQRGRLLGSKDPEIARLAREVLGQSTSRNRAQVVADYTSALNLPADRVRGEKVFARECRTCHKVGEQGHAVGPDLTGSPSRDSAAILVHVLDPNQYVLPDYIQYIVVDNSGRTFTGIIAAETATSVTLRRGDNAQDTLLRGSIEEMAGTGQSLMPEGFEKTISKQDMADLIAFLRASHRGDDGSGADSPRQSGGNQPLDIGTLPGLIEPD